MNWVKGRVKGMLYPSPEYENEYEYVIEPEVEIENEKVYRGEEILKEE